MGNCLFGGLENVDGAIKVMTSNGGVMEFYTPITVGAITGEFPGHSIFNRNDLFWKPLSQDQELFPGKAYYILPPAGQTDPSAGREGHLRSNSSPESLAPFRMSSENGRLMKRTHGEPFSRENKSSGIWKVKLVINPKQLVEVLAEEGSREELIQSVRTVAKCGSSGGYSDQWSFSSCSSRNASSKNGAL